MADKVWVNSGDQWRYVFDEPHVLERYKMLGWKRSKKGPPKPKPIDHPRELE